MRFELVPGGDVEVPSGSVLMRTRSALAVLTGVAALADAVLSVDGRVLADDQVAGAAPWVHGSRVRIGHGPADPLAVAAGAPWHVAVLCGPDAGTVAAPGADGLLRVGRRPRVPAPAAEGGRAQGMRRPERPPELALTDESVSQPHLDIRAARRAGRWRVHDLHSANGTRVSADPGRRAWCRTRVVRRRARVLRAGDRLVVGASTLAVRRAGDVGHLPQPEPAAVMRVPTVAWVLPVAASLVLAAVTRNPMLLALGLSGLGPALPGLLHRRRRPRRPADDLAPDPSATAVSLVTTLPRAAPADGVTAAAPELPSAGVMPPWWDLARDGLAVVGPRAAALATSRALLMAALAANAGPSTVRMSLLVRPDHAHDWAWCRWLDLRHAGRIGSEASSAHVVLDAEVDGPLVVVSDRGAPWRVALHRWDSARSRAERVLVVEDDAALVPAWCRWVLAVPGDGTATLTGPEGTRAVVAPAAPSTWTDDLARRLGARDHADQARTARSHGDQQQVVPEVVSLEDLGLPADVAALRRRWRLCTDDEVPDPVLPGLRATLGVGAGGQVSVDLVTEGPHLLVAGTTGAGKSELLQSLVLALALRHPPSELAVVLIDFKGGASLGRCRDLPHVVGEVTDLDPVEAGRALDGLRAELRRRERLLAAAGVPDVDALRALHPEQAPPRLLVVVDELRALVEDLPDVLPSLVRLSAQGRSLGIHLVLATQRPAGAVSAQVRANVALRICLRVADAADSLDVVEVPDASELPVDRPGRALLRRGNGAPELVQTAWAALGPGGASTVARPAPAVWAPPFTSAERARPIAGNDNAGVLVDRARLAAAGLAPPSPLWCPPLPTAIRADALAATVRAAAIAPGAGGQAAAARSPGALVLGITDLPAIQGRGLLTWDPSRGPLVVAGRSGSGRTTTLRTVAHAALAQGRAVHVLTGADQEPRAGGPTDDGRPDPAASWLTDLDGLPGVGTVVAGDDPRRAARLLVLLAQGRSPGSVLLVDDVASVARSLDRVPRGAAAGLLDTLVRGSHRSTSVALAGQPHDLVRWAPHAGTRLVLSVTDPHDDAMLGIGREMSGGRGTPGRGVVLDGTSSRCQVALPAPQAGAEGQRDRLEALSHGGTPPLRLAALPRAVAAAQLAPPATSRRALAPSGSDGPGGSHVPVGLGGDDGTRVHADTALGLLVVGPAGSGRTSALAIIAAGLPGSAAFLCGADRDGALPPGQVARAIRAMAAEPPGVVVVDHLDLVLRADPGLDDVLSTWVMHAELGQ
ncbi:MAG: FHA domain-containing protein, partial [Cellulomonadaceae bacterium]|nr:FHA domain-containing protein [Cellulomonadaceae bacterium]